MRLLHRWNVTASVSWARLCLLFLIWAVAAPLLDEGDLRAYTQGRSRDAVAQQKRNSSAIAAVFGNVRAAVSDIVFIKTERYLHGGVAYVPAPPAAEAAAGESCQHEHHNHAHEDACDADAPDQGLLCDGKPKATLIKAAGGDFRSFIGDLHREVKPWLDAEKAHAAHQSGREILPWFRVMTLSDPHFVRGYAVGGWWLANEDPAAALTFLQEGVDRNPEAFQIYQTMALVYRREAKTVRDDRALMSRALALARTGAELACDQRPPDWQEDHPSAGWNIYLEDDAFGVSRLAVLLTRHLHGDEAARRLGRVYLARLGRDDALEALVDGVSEGHLD